MYSNFTQLPLGHANRMVLVSVSTPCIGRVDMSWRCAGVAQDFISGAYSVGVCLGVDSTGQIAPWTRPFRETERQ